jgi:hypothetical protein
MKAIRNALRIPSRHHSEIDEIEAIAKVGNDFGWDIAQRGVPIDVLGVALSRELAEDQVQATTEVLTVLKPLQTGRREVKLVDKIKVSDLMPPPHVAQGSIIFVRSKSNAQLGHVFLSERTMPEHSFISLIDPFWPEDTIILEAIEASAASGLRGTFLVNPIGIASETLWVTGVIRVRLSE